MDYTEYDNGRAAALFVVLAGGIFYSLFAALRHRRGR